MPESVRPTLVIDRSPRVFESIVAHLQGYRIQPQTETEYLHLLVDAKYYHLPRLVQQIAESAIFVRVGGKSFRIPRSLFSGPGNAQNLFTLGFAGFFHTETQRLTLPENKDVFAKEVRPPPLDVPDIPHRSARLFSDLLGLLEGAPVPIQDDEHRNNLLEECRYYRFCGLEQKLLEHRIRRDRCRQTDEITLNVADIVPENVSLQPIRSGYDTGFYQRPYIDTKPRELVFQIKDLELAALIKTPPAKWEVSFYDEAREQISRIVAFLCDRFQCKPDMGSNGYVVKVDHSAISLNGKALNPLTVCSKPQTDGKDRQLGPSTPLEMVCDRSQWRILRTEQGLLCFELLTADCHCGQRYVNARRKVV